MQLIGRIHTEAKHAYVSQKPKHFDDLLMKVFRNALHHEIQNRIENQHPRRLKDLTYLGHEVEQKIRKQVIAPVEINNNETTAVYEIKGKVTALETQLKTVLDSINDLKNDSHRDYEHRNQSNNNDRDKSQIRIKGNCYTCDKPGHSFRDCRSTKSYRC